MKWIVDKFYGGNFRYFVKVFFLVAALMWTLGYISAVNSEAYNFAQQYIRANPKVIEAFGPIKSVRLGIFNFRNGYSAGTWKARFNIVTDGTKKKGTVFLSLKSTNEGWVVEEENLSIE